MNRPIPSDLLIETSLAALPEPETATTFDVGEAGAGFGLSKLSPVHAAMLSAAISNEGRMMAPHIVRRARDAKGNIVYQAEPRLIGTPMDPASASKMMTLLKATVLQGTSRSHFLRRDTKRFRAEIGGKTGTLRDLEERKTLYTWFSGVGAAGDGEPGLALGVLVASPVNWLVRASSVASNSLGKYYAIHQDEDRFARGQKN
jgi:cell division protein FtsI/penicillin-binding protein 2